MTLPAEVDFSNADAIREELLTLLNRGASVLILDMSGTLFCDCAGVGTVLRTLSRASAAGAELRVVTGGQLVRRIFELTGADRLVSTYPALAAALAGLPGPARPGGDAPGQASASPA